MIVNIDKDLCTGCQECVKVCPVSAITGEPHKPQEIDADKCVICGQCVQVCKSYASIIDHGEEFVTNKKQERKIPDVINEPLFAANNVCDIDKVKAALKDPSKITMVQCAPAVRVALGEDFGMELGSLTPGKMAAALKALNFDKIYDTNFAADLTIMEEGNELIKRVTEGGTLPMFTSCCPAWVKYVEGKYPEFISNLSTVKSPNAIMGALVKSYFSQENHIPKEKIVTVGIVPCTAKKFESSRKELMNDGFKNVDYYLTTTEVSMMIKENKIDFKNIRLSEFDKLMGKTSSSGVIFGSTGGVTESVLRAVSYLNGKSEDKNTCEVIRDTKDFKEVSVSIGSMKLNVLVVYGLKNAKEVLDKIKNKTVKYDFVEVMSCPMGCVGGAGNKLSNINKLDEVRDMRKDLLNLFDSEMIVRNCFQNKEMMKLFNGYLNKERIKNYLHTSFSKKSLTK